MKVESQARLPTPAALDSAPIEDGHAQVPQHVVQPVDDKTGGNHPGQFLPGRFRIERAQPSLERGYFRTQKMPLARFHHRRNGPDQLDRVLQDCLCLGIPGIVQRAQQMGIQGPLGRIGSEEMGQQTAGTVGMNPEGCRLRCGKLDFSIQGNEIGRQRFAHRQTGFQRIGRSQGTSLAGGTDHLPQFHHDFSAGFVFREKFRDQGGASNADDGRARPRGRDVKDVVGTLVSPQRNDGGGVACQHGGVSAEIPQEVGAHRAKSHPEGKRENE